MCLLATRYASIFVHISLDLLYMGGKFIFFSQTHFKPSIFTFADHPSICFIYFAYDVFWYDGYAEEVRAGVTKPSQGPPTGGGPIFRPPPPRDLQEGQVKGMSILHKLMGRVLWSILFHMGLREEGGVR